MKTLSTISFCLFVVYSHAQITLTAQNNISGVGGTYSYLTEIISFDVDNSGPDQVWDMSSASGTGVEIAYVHPDETADGSFFPEANIVEQSGGIDVYFSLVNEDFTNYGFSIPGTLRAFYDNPQTMLTFPFSYADSFDDTFSGTLLDLSTKDTYSRNGNLSVTADGYGDLILPYGTLENALRVRTYVTVTDSVDGQGFTVSQNTYTWYDAEFGSIIANYSNIEQLDGSVIDVATIVSEEDYTFIKEASLEKALLIYPNPATNKFQIEGITGEFTTQIYSQVGKLVDEITTHDSAQLDVSQYTAGIYIVEIRQNGTVLRKKLVVQ